MLPGSSYLVRSHLFRSLCLRHFLQRSISIQETLWFASTMSQRMTARMEESGLVHVQPEKQNSIRFSISEIKELKNFIEKHQRSQEASQWTWCRKPEETVRNRRKSFSESFRKHYIIVCNWNVMKWWVFHNSLLAYETSMCNWCWNFEPHSPRLEKNTFVFPTWTFIMIWFCAFWTIERSERLEETENVCRQGAPLRLPRSTPVLVENSTNMQKWMKMVEVQISGLQLLECHRSHSPPTARHNRHVTNYRRYKGFFDCRAYLISSSYHLISGWS